MMPITTTLDTGWQVAERIPAGRELLFPQGGERDWLPAAVPGHVHLDLTAAGVLADPFFRMQERSARWVDEADWTYRTTFDVSVERLAARGAHGRHYLDFHGLDTLARVFLNGALIGAAENMFVPHRFDVTAHLREGANELRVEFDSALRAGQERAAAYLGDGTSDRGRQTYFNFGPRAFVRKAQYMFGWDWGPELVSCGIWKPVELVTVPLAEIVDWRMEYRFLDPVTVDITVRVTVDKHDPRPLTVGAALYAPGDNTPDARLPDAPGRHTVVLRIPEQMVARWNPNGLDVQPSVNGIRPRGGPRKRYLLNLRVWETDADPDEREFVEHKGASVGFRELELVREPDADGKGESFLFRVNGVDTYIKGANWIPDHSFPGAITRERLRQRLTQARDASFNMLRVWGGGLYESEDFYSLCDELGILVWQDFCLACSMYPDDDAVFVENVRQEATLAVRRIRSHPSLALWCGGNENLELFQGRWSGDAQATKFYGEKLIHEVFPAVLAEEDSATPYWPNSPYSGTPEKHSQSPDFGDAHYWAVWHSHGGSTGDWVHYAESNTRFSSEFGFASPCGMAAWESCSLPEDRADPRSPVARWHDKTRKGYETYLAYIEKHFPKIETFEDLVYYGQANQAMALQFGIEHWRRIKGRCWGTLFWQINDCWPTQSWAVIDSLGEPKAAYYACKRFYAPLLLSLVRNGDAVEAHLVNDGLTEVPGEVRLRFFTRSGQTGEAVTTTTTAPANAASGTVLTASVPADAAACRAEFLGADGVTLAENTLLLAEPKELSGRRGGVLSVLSKPDGAGGVTVTVSSSTLAPFVWLRFDGLGRVPTFSDNWFHLLPGESRTVTIGNLPAGLSDDEVSALLQAGGLRVRHL
jgi:beta-mannosidase